jgi:hypothetical protein
MILTFLVKKSHLRKVIGRKLMLYLRQLERSDQMKIALPINSAARMAGTII